MAEYTKIETARAIICDMCKCLYPDEDCPGKCDWMKYLKEDAADVAPVVHGRWTAQCVVETDGGWTLEDMPYNEYQHSNPICSICRKTALLDGGEDYVTSPYCPNCGAKMDSEVE